MTGLPSPFSMWNLTDGPSGALATQRYKSFRLRASKNTTLEHPYSADGVAWCSAGVGLLAQLPVASTEDKPACWQHIKADEGPHLHVRHFIDHHPVGLCVQLGILFAVREQLAKVQHQVAIPAIRQATTSALLNTRLQHKQTLTGTAPHLCVMPLELSKSTLSLFLKTGTPSAPFWSLEGTCRSTSFPSGSAAGALRFLMMNRLQEQVLTYLTSL